MDITGRADLVGFDQEFVDRAEGRAEFARAVLEYRVEFCTPLEAGIALPCAVLVNS